MYSSLSSLLFFMALYSFFFFFFFPLWICWARRWTLLKHFVGCIICFVTLWGPWNVRHILFLLFLLFPPWCSFFFLLFGKCVCVCIRNYWWEAIVSLLVILRLQQSGFVWLLLLESAECRACSVLKPKKGGGGERSMAPFELDEGNGAWKSWSNNNEELAGASQSRTSKGLELARGDSGIGLIHIFSVWWMNFIAKFCDATKNEKRRENRLNEYDTPRSIDHPVFIARIRNQRHCYMATIYAILYDSIIIPVFFSLQFYFFLYFWFYLFFLFPSHSRRHRLLGRFVTIIYTSAADERKKK